MAEDDAIPRLMGRGHSSTALIHGKGQVRNWSDYTLPGIKDKGDSFCLYVLPYNTLKFIRILRVIRVLYFNKRSDKLKWKMAVCIYSLYLFLLTVVAKWMFLNTT